MSESQNKTKSSGKDFLKVAGNIRRAKWQPLFNNASNDEGPCQELWKIKPALQGNQCPGHSWFQDRHHRQLFCGRDQWALVRDRSKGIGNITDVAGGNSINGISYRDQCWEEGDNGRAPMLRFIMGISTENSERSSGFSCAQSAVPLFCYIKISVC